MVPYLGLLLVFEASSEGNSTKKETALSLLDLLPVGDNKKKFTSKYFVIQFEAIKESSKSPLSSGGRPAYMDWVNRLLPVDLAECDLQK